MAKYFIIAGVIITFAGIILYFCRVPCGGLAGCRGIFASKEKT
jgi:hypothetical protein